ncbi:MAG: LLM class F420-dependent oxidoreductase, partial [Mycobacteriaceae bacterium]
TMWKAAGREGAPRIVVLDGKPDSDRLVRWKDLGVTEVVYGLPDKPEEDVVAYLGRLAAKLGR